MLLGITLSSSSIVSSTTIPMSSSSPKAVAIVLGPLGASAALLQNTFAAWYRRRDCSVVTGASPPLRFMRNASLQPTATTIWQETLQVLRETPPTVPLVVHMFSNGGAFVWHAMLQDLEAEVASPEQLSSNRTDAHSSLTTDDRRLLQARLQTGYILFDSCPCYIRTLWDGSHWKDSFPFSGWSSWGRSAYTLGAATALTTWLTLTLAWSKPSQLWQEISQKSSVRASHHVYVYTTADRLSDASAVDRLVAERRTSTTMEATAAATTTTTVHRYEDSGHCRMHVDHPTDYQRMIDEALEAAVARGQSTR